MANQFRHWTFLERASSERIGGRYCLGDAKPKTRKVPRPAALRCASGGTIGQASEGTPGRTSARTHRCIDGTVRVARRYKSDVQAACPRGSVSPHARARCEERRGTLAKRVSAHAPKNPNSNGRPRFRRCLRALHRNGTAKRPRRAAPHTSRARSSPPHRQRFDCAAHAAEPATVAFCIRRSTVEFQPHKHRTNSPAIRRLTHTAYALHFAQ